MSARKPNTIKELQGTYRKDRDQSLSGLNPEIIEVLPKPSRKLDRYARAAWSSLGQELVKNKILTTMDLMSFEIFCVLSGEIAKLAEDFRKYSVRATGTYTNRAKVSNTVISPQYRLFQSLLKDWLVFAGHYGLTPLSRGRINPPPKSTGEQLSIFDFIKSTN